MRRAFRPAFTGPRLSRRRSVLPAQPPAWCRPDRFPAPHVAQALPKRAFDVSLALVLAGPAICVGLVAAVLLLAVQGRPVLHGAERMATPRRGFVMWKFRTMTPSAEGPSVSGGHMAARVTPLGRIFRRWRLDELPQLWNILVGDMSFVGPRPPLRSVAERFPDLYSGVLTSRPGLTGLATLCYRRREARLLAACASAEEATALYDRRCVPAKARLDRLYARRQTVALDLVILWATVTGRLPRALRRPLGRRLPAAGRSGRATGSETRPRGSTG
ncbi:MAG: sugar transferase, partial [Thermoleophilia bacterium]|nr:sugar transferase [Thermoleophilia bacterium]